MNIINITLGVDTQPCSAITLGRRGENEVTQVVVDFSSWVEEFGAGVITLLAMRSQDTSAYPVVLTLASNTATWDVTSTDTAFKGSGRAEFIYTVGEQIAKSVVFNTVVMQDIGEPSETPPDPYEEWLERLTELGAETQANAEAAQQSAEDAEQSAQEAAQEATNAEGYAEQAGEYASAAQSAEAASESARDEAQTAQASAEASATAASGSAASAAGSATAAAGSASNASASATSAGASATTASTAATRAEAAKTAAQAAQSAAEDAAEDAQQAAQEAHVEYEQLSGEVDDLSDEVSQQKSAIEDLEALTNRKAGMLVDTASGAIASFVPDATIDNLLGLTVDIEPVQAGSGDPSPDNVRPISGWDAVEVQTTGVNILPFPYAETSLSRFGITYTVNDDGTITANGTATNDSWFILSNAWPYTADRITGRTIRLSGCPTGGSTSTFFIRSVVTGHNDVGSGVSINSFRAGYFRFQISIKSGTTVNNLVFKPMVVFGSSVLPYKPYTGNRYTIALGQTVYGGTLDATAGTLTVNRAMLTLDGTQTELGGVNWRPRANSVGFYYNFIGLNIKDPPTISVATEAIADSSKAVAYDVIYSNDICSFAVIHTAGYQRICVRITDTTLTTSAAVNAYLAQHPITICYPLATPITIDLDPVTISTISGQTNNVWADAGDVSVTYAADIKAYIDRMNQPTEDDMIANSLIASGKYFTVNNRLFLSTASIAAGAQIIPGTNCTKTSLAAALNAINA